MSANNKLRQLTGLLKDKATILWEYYKVEMIIGITVVLFLTVQIWQVSVSKDEALRAVFLNVSQKSENCSDYIDDFAQTVQLDTDKYCITTDTSMMFSLELIGDEATYTTNQKLGVLFAAGDVDIFASDEDAFLHFAYQDFFTDLRTVFTQEQLTNLQHQLYYIDGYVLQEKEDYNNALELYSKPYPSPTAPETMQDPIPIGLIIPSNSDFVDNYTIAGDTAVVGIGCTSSNIELSAKFIQFVTQP